MINHILYSEKKSKTYMAYKTNTVVIFSLNKVNKCVTKTCFNLFQDKGVHNKS